MQDAAVRYATAGYKVFPLSPGRKRPHGALVPHGVRDATDDVATVRRWFSREPSANLGLACDGLLVVDCDPGNTWPGFGRLTAENACPMQSTPRGGVHFVFRRPEGKAWGNSQNRVSAKIDTRTDGGYIVADPSRTVDDPDERTVEGEYAFESPLPPKDELPYPPDWLVDQLDAVFAPKPLMLPPPVGVPSVASDVTERAIAYLAACPPALSGQGGHNQTFAVTQALVHGFCLEPETAMRLLQEHYNPRCEPPWSERELLHKVDSAVKNPSDKPRGWLRDHSELAAWADTSRIMGMSAGHSGLSSDISHNGQILADIPHDGHMSADISHDGHMSSDISHNGQISANISHDGHSLADNADISQIVGMSVAPSGFSADDTESNDAETEEPDPGVFPDHLLEVPGLIGEICAIHLGNELHASAGPLAGRRTGLPRLSGGPEGL